MTPSHQALAAYASPAAPIRTPRGLEYELFARVTRRLAAGMAEGPRLTPALIAALHDNRILWGTLAADVASPGNRLPEELRARLFWLAQFTTLHSRRVLAGEAGAGVLVEINTAVMRGLRAGAPGGGT